VLHDNTITSRADLTTRTKHFVIRTFVPIRFFCLSVSQVSVLRRAVKTPKYRHVTNQPQHVSCLVCLAPRTIALLHYVLRSRLLAKQNTRSQTVYETMYMVHETLEGYLRPEVKVMSS
jgi:hypothetical protein